MLDQSFSAKNFYNILVYQNRKGENLEGRFFKDKIFDIYTVEIKRLNSCIRERRKYIQESGKDKKIFFRYRRLLNFYKRKVKVKKKESLIALLHEVSTNINNPDFKIELITGEARGKTIYQLDDTPENYFLNKQLQYNFRKTYKVKQANRFQIVEQLGKLLDDKFPKYIVRTDIKSFYESIPVDKIASKINEDNLLSPLSKKFIRQIIYGYKQLSGNEVGVPRGIGISAYLSELYLRNIDNEIRQLKNLMYYQRYVDDIVVIFYPETLQDLKTNHLEDIRKIFNSNDLELNEDEEKTKVAELSGNSSKKVDLNYLGYKYTIKDSTSWTERKLEVSLTDVKIDRFKKKIDLTIKAYKEQVNINKRRAASLLKSRIVFMTNNTRLTNNKGHILTGIYFSNRLITHGKNQLQELDTYLSNEIDGLDLSLKQKNRLKTFSFSSGFDNKTFVKFTTTDMAFIMKAWKSI